MHTMSANAECETHFHNMSQTSVGKSLCNSLIHCETGS